MKIDFASPVWGAIAAYANDQIEKLRLKNEADLDLVETSLVRGEIRAFKKLLALPALAEIERQVDLTDI